MIRTPDQRLRVFISSTLKELAEERAAVQEAVSHLRLVPVMFELGARPHPPAELYQAYLRQSHVFIGLYWQRYGWVAPGMGISGLEDEWLLAADHPKLVYIKEPAVEREPGLTGLLDRIRDDNSTSYRSFSSADELRDLVENDLAVMLSERFEAAIEDPAPAPPSSTGRMTAVPRPPAGLIGRQVELQTLRELIVRDDTRLVTITGAGGSGKTRLAVELATALGDDLGWQVRWVDLTRIRSSGLVLQTIAAALGIKDPGEVTLIEAIASVMRGKASLLVIDNFEHVIETAAELGEILAVTEDVKLVVTSRQPLHLRWEQEFALLPLEVPDADRASPDAVGASPAVELFVDRARRVRPDFALTDANVAAVGEIARRLDGLPLALELAAARIRVLSPPDLLDRLERRLDPLSGTSPDMPERHRTLREAIAWSYDLLSPEEQRMFRRLAVFTGGAGLQAVEGVCAGDGIESADVLDLVSGLVDKSLVAVTGGLGGRTRFRLLETIREYAAEQVVEAGEAEVLWDRHLAWHVDLAEQAWQGFWSADMPAWMDVLEREHANMRTALDHAGGSGSVTLGLRIAAALWPFWDVRGRYREGAARLEVLLAADSDRSLPAYGRALSAHGWLVALMGDFVRADELMRQGLPIVRAYGTPDQLAWSLAEHGNVLFSLGDAEGAGSTFTEALDLARQKTDTFLIGFCVFGLAYVALLEGDIEGMKAHLQESLDLTRLMIQPWGIAWAQFSVGVVAILEGDAAAAVAPLVESLQLRWSIRDARGLAESIQLLATLASTQGDAEWSAILHGSAEVQREANGLTILPFLRPLHDESVARLRAALDAPALEEIWQLGRTMPLEKVVHEALERRP